MEDINILVKFLFFLIAITLNTSSPLPSLPLIIFNYISNNFLFAFSSTIVGTLFSSYIQYLFVKKIYKLKKLRTLNKINIFAMKKLGKRRNTIKKFTKIIRNATFLDFFIIRLSSIFSFKLTNLFCGLVGYPLKKFLLVTLLSIIPWNVFYYLAVKSNNLIVSDIFELKSSELNIDILKIPLINFIYLITVIYLISKLISYFIKKYNNFSN